MSRIRFHDSNSENWQSFRELTPPDMHSHFSELELSSEIFMHEKGTETSLQLSEVHYLPNVSIDLHAHDEEEIFYILRGEMIIGARRLTPGHSIFISRETLYSLKAGADGVDFLVFRPRGDMSYIPRDVFQQRSHQNR